MSKGQSQVSAELAGVVDLSGEAVHQEQAISDQSGATMRASFASPPQEVSDVSAKGDIAEIPDREVETYANVGAFTSLEQATHTALGLGIGVGFSVGGDSAPVASGFPLTSHQYLLTAYAASRDSSQKEKSQELNYLVYLLTYLLTCT